MKTTFTNCCFAILFLFYGLMSNTTVAAPPVQEQPLTVAEKSDFTATSTSAEVAEFVAWCADHAEHVRQVKFGSTVEGRDMIAAVVSTEPYELGQQDDRAVALVIGNIHSGECAGKEALLMLLRNLTHHPEHPWLKNSVLIIVPNYNADANDRMGKFNRPGQVGPEQGMGQRPNAQGLDLNRDFVKLESPEARSLIGLIDKVNPHLFIDCHTTNGSRHQYALTYDIPHNPATAGPIRDYLRNKMMPTVTQRLADAGTLTFYYGNFDRDHTSWTTYGHEPRYSTEYVGLRGRLAILSEAYSYISYRDRIFASRDFVSECLNFLHENADTVQKLLQEVDREWIETASQQPQRIQFPLSARVVPFPQKFVVKGFDGDAPKDYEVDFVGNYEPTRTTPLPYAYVIPREFARPVDRLLMHGVVVEQLSDDVEADVEVDTIVELNRAERAFQKHRMVQCETERKQERRRLAKGSYVVRTAQPLGRLAAYMLEATSDDGLVFWNFFDDALEIGHPYPVVRIADVTKLDVERVDHVEPMGRIDEDLIDGPRQLVPDATAPEWTPDGKLLLEENGRKRVVDPVTLSSDAAPARRGLRQLQERLVALGFAEDAARGLAAADPVYSKSRKWLALTKDHSAAVLHLKDDEVGYRLGDGSSVVELVRFSDNEEYVAWHDGVLNFVRLSDGRQTRLESDSKDILIGKLDWVYQEELYGRGNFQGFWLQPADAGQTQHVAFFKLDESRVEKFPIVDHLPIVNDLEMMSYPKAGDPNPTVSLGIVSVDNPTEVQWIDLENYGSEFLISQVGWKPDGTALAFQVQNREQTWLDLCLVPTGEKNPRVLFRDQTAGWIESPGQPIWMADGGFLWLSPRDGYRHLYRYDSSGSLVSQMTTGSWEIRSVLGLASGSDEPARVYFTAAHPNPTEMHVWRLDVDSGEVTRVTSDPGTHEVSFSPDWKFFLDTYSRAHSPAEYRLYRSDGTLLHKLLVRSDDRFEYLRVQPPKFLEVEPDADQPMDAMLILPPDFDPAKKYPVLVHIYAGPQAPRVRDRFGGNWYLWHQMLAQNGYVIWMCDNRSASYRSSRNVWPIHRDLGRNELADIERGIDWLVEQGWADPQRIGIWGWSYGGYMTAYTLTHSDRFRMGISGAPVTDWRNYDTIYTERLMGTPQSNPDGYAATSVVKSASRLHGQMLLVHGSIDENVHMSNSLQFAYELQKAGMPFELMIYPKNRHAIRDPAQARHLREMMFRFVKENL